MALRSREIVATVCALCTELLQAPAPRVKELGQGRARPLRRPTLDQAPLLFSRGSGPEEVNSEVQVMLQATALQRLSVIRSALAVVVAVLLGSESTAHRHGMLSGPSPLDVSDWCALLVPDLYERLCARLGIAPDGEEQEVARALKATVDIAGGRGVPGGAFSSSFTRLAADRTSRYSTSSMARSEVWLKTTGQHVADSLLQPIKEKLQAQQDRVESMLARACPVGSLAEVRRAVRDLQQVVAYHLATIAATGYSARNMAALSRNPTAPAPPHAVLYFGDFFSRAEGWETALEEAVVRVSTLLEDMLCSEQLSKVRIQTPSSPTPLHPPPRIRLAPSPP